MNEGSAKYVAAAVHTRSVHTLVSRFDAAIPDKVSCDFAEGNADLVEMITAESRFENPLQVHALCGNEHVQADVVVVRATIVVGLYSLRLDPLFGTVGPESVRSESVVGCEVEFTDGTHYQVSFDEVHRPAGGTLLERHLLGDRLERDTYHRSRLVVSGHEKTSAQRQLYRDLDFWRVGLTADGLDIPVSSDPLLQTITCTAGPVPRKGNTGISSHWIAESGELDVSPTRLIGMDMEATYDRGMEITYSIDHVADTAAVW